MNPKTRFNLVPLIILITLVTATPFLAQHNLLSMDLTPSGFHVGVTFCGNTTAQAKLLINKVRTYTNLFVLQSGPVSKNETATQEICDYAITSGLDTIVYFGWFDPDCPWQLPWIESAKQQWGKRFLGVYYYDEPGGIQLEGNWSHYFQIIKRFNSTRYQLHALAIEAYLNGSSMFRSHDDSAAVYIATFQNYRDIKALKERSTTMFTSDYALWWWNYQAGYDVLFAQFGWNNSEVQDMALVRGASRMQNKSWGAMITWKYDEPPYLDSAEETYRQMRMAYDAGASYVVVFNYPQIEGNPYGILTDEHFRALERFWCSVVSPFSQKTISKSTQAEAVLVLPRNYGWGMRRIDDRIWYWGPDEKSPQVWNISRRLLSEYGVRLDIVYDDEAFPVEGKYSKICYWNGTESNEKK